MAPTQATEALYDKWYELQLKVLPFVTLLDTKRFIIMLAKLFLWGCGITVALMIPGGCTSMPPAFLGLLPKECGGGGGQRGFRM
jgi:hypothetical protein